MESSVSAHAQAIQFIKSHSDNGPEVRCIICQPLCQLKKGASCHKEDYWYIEDRF